MRKKSFVWIAAAVAVVAGAFLVLGGRQKAEPKYRTAKVERGDVTQTVAATGTLSAVTTVKVGSVVSGNVAALHADFNKQVKKGDLLAELDPVPFQERVAQTRRAARQGRGRRAQRRDRAAPPEGAVGREARGAGRSRPGAGQLRLGDGRGQPGAGLARAGGDGPAQQPDRGADRRRRRRPAVRRRPDRGRLLHGADDLHDRAGPDEDAGLGRRLRVGHRHVQGRPAGALHGGRVPGPDVPRKDRADPPERHGQPERRDVPGHHRGRESGAGAAPEHDRQRLDRRRDRAGRAPHPECGAALPARGDGGARRLRPARLPRSARRAARGTGPAGAARQFDRARRAAARGPGQTVYTIAAPQAGDPEPVEIKAGHHRRPLHAGDGGRAEGRASSSSSASSRRKPTPPRAAIPWRAAVPGGPGGGRRF